MEEARSGATLPGRQSILPTCATVEGWLRRHPQLCVISRDRASDYAQAAERAAPQARQIANSFHLLVNARECLERFIQRHPTLLHETRCNAWSIARRLPNACLVRRGKIILTAATGASTTQITQDLHVDHETVRLWCERWRTAETRLQAIEATGKQKLLSQAIEELLTDEQRPGAPSLFTFEPFMQVIGLACEKPITTCLAKR